MATITREELVKQAGILKSLGRMGQAGLKGVDQAALAAGRGIKKGIEKTTDVLNTANGGKARGFEEAHLGMKRKDGGGLVGKMWNKKHNAKVEADRKDFRAKPLKERVEQVRQQTGSDSKARQYKSIARTQQITRGALIGATGTAVGAHQYKKHKKRKEEQAALNNYYANQGYYQ